ncbi:MAG: undecaprenyl-diphosphate phosphatase [Candidatus Omnitrophica bacterium]|nr:undecaprenyl-diphosphate phosphatase [Candidatus Omnitrophota bacterium]
MNVIQAVILGIVEGITEFLPVSSTGHLILVAKLLGLAQTEFQKSFEIAIQLGAIFSVILLYRKTLLGGLDIWRRILLAFLPSACIGLVFYKTVKRLLLANGTLVLWSLFLGGIFLIIFEMFYQKKGGAKQEVKSISYAQSIYIGLFQTIAFIPGVSRAAATIMGGLILGLERKAIVEFSFLLAIPTMLAAAGLDLLHEAGSFTAQDFFLLGIGFLASFFVATIAVKFLLAFIKRNNFILFGVYRIIIVIFFWLVWMHK